jgi:hypothetical protein
MTSPLNRKPKPISEFVKRYALSDSGRTLSASKIVEAIWIEYELEEKVNKETNKRRLSDGKEEINRPDKR